MSRYANRNILINDTEQYKEISKKKGVKYITHYGTLEREVFEQKIYDAMETFSYVWKTGDMFWKLSSRFFGDPQYWWVIASFNNRPTEHHCNAGDLIKIPISLSDALQVVE